MNIPIKANENSQLDESFWSVSPGFIAAGPPQFVPEQPNRRSGVSTVALVDSGGGRAAQDAGGAAVLLSRRPELPEHGEGQLALLVGDLGPDGAEI